MSIWVVDKPVQTTWNIVATPSLLFTCLSTQTQLFVTIFYIYTYTSVSSNYFTPATTLSRNCPRVVVPFHVHSLDIYSGERFEPSRKDLGRKTYVLLPRINSRCFSILLNSFVVFFLFFFFFFFFFFVENEIFCKLWWYLNANTYTVCLANWWRWSKQICSKLTCLLQQVNCILNLLHAFHLSLDF